MAPILQVPTSDEATSQSLARPTPLEAAKRELDLADLTRELPAQALSLAVFGSATHGFRDTDQHQEFLDAKAAGKRSHLQEYGRYGSPTRDFCEKALALCHRAESAILYPSGMAAVEGIFSTFLRPGDRLVIGDDCYRKSRNSAERLREFEIDVTLLPMGNYEELEALLQEGITMVFLESPTNPFLRVTDLDRVVRLCRKYGAKLIVDGTLSSSPNQLPLLAGVDLVIDSATKYLGGYNDLIAGVTYGSKEMVARLKEDQGRAGNISHDLDASKLWNGIRSLDTRMAQYNKVGQRVAEFLEAHPCVNDVYYPGLTSHPDHQIAKSQMKGFGSLVTFRLRASENSETLADISTTNRFLNSSRLSIIAPSLGGVVDLIEAPLTMSHTSTPPDVRKRIGVSEDLVRFAGGLHENPAIVVADFDAMFHKTFGVPITESLGEEHVELVKLILREQ